MKQMGQRIRQAREQRGLSQDDFARLIGKDQRAVSEYEHGKRKVPAHELPTFARVLDVPVMSFFGDVESPRDLDHQLMEVFHALPTTQSQQAAIELVRLLGQTLEDHRQ